MSNRALESMLRPKSVAAIGASRRGHAVGNIVLRNILDGRFGGPVYAVNPHRLAVRGAIWAPSIDNLPEAPSIAIVATSARHVPDIVRRLARRGAGIAVVLANGLGEAKERSQIRDALRGSELRVIGPNCFGIILPGAALNGAFGEPLPASGHLAFLSQSGATAATALDVARETGVGFSCIASVGDELDVDLSELIDVHVADPRTTAIAVHLEAMRDAQKLLSAVRAASAIKPIVVVKAGRTAGAARAVSSHTGALIGSYDVYAAALRRSGAILVDDFSELMAAGAALSTAPLRVGPRVAVITNGGGAGIMAVDELLARGMQLAMLQPGTVKRLGRVLPSCWSQGNPVDILGDATAERLGATLRTVLDDPEVDAALVISCPTAIEAPQAYARATILAAASSSKGVFGCWLGPGHARLAGPEFAASGLPLFSRLEDAVCAISCAARAAEIAAAPLASPAPSLSMPPHDRARARAIIAEARRAGRTVLDPKEVSDLLRAYGIEVCPSQFAADLETVASACRRLAPPYAVKIRSPTATHRSDIGGVTLDLRDAAAARTAAARMLEDISRQHPEVQIDGFDVQSMATDHHVRELIVGVALDATFGPVLMFGAGGTAVEIIRDRAVELPPLDDGLAREMIRRTRVSRLLDGYRNVPAADTRAIVRVLEAMSALAVDFPEIEELEINPLFASPTGAVAGDARMTITTAPREQRMAIAPWPREWEAALPTRGGLLLRVRPVRPDDEGLLAELFQHVSSQDLRFRFLAGMREVNRERLIGMTRIDYRRAMHFIAFSDTVIVASAMLAIDPAGLTSEVAISVREGFKGKGVSWSLMEHVLAYARSRGIREVVSVESVDNQSAIRLEHEMGFETIEAEGAEQVVRKRLDA